LISYILHDSKKSLLDGQHVVRQGEKYYILKSAKLCVDYRESPTHATVADGYRILREVVYDEDGGISTVCNHDRAFFYYGKKLQTIKTNEKYNNDTPSTSITASEGKSIATTKKDLAKNDPLKSFTIGENQAREASKRRNV